MSCKNAFQSAKLLILFIRRAYQHVSLRHRSHPTIQIYKSMDNSFITPPLSLNATGSATSVPLSKEIYLFLVFGICEGGTDRIQRPLRI